MPTVLNSIAFYAAARWDPNPLAFTVGSAGAQLGCDQVAGGRLPAAPARRRKTGTRVGGKRVRMDSRSAYICSSRTTLC